MTAVEALRRARATATHSRSDAGAACEVVGHEVSDAHAELWSNPTDTRDDYRRWHAAVASALLDGFSVEEVTAAEHTTDQPHE